MDMNFNIKLSAKQENGDEVLPHHVEGLKESAIAYVLEMAGDDCREGEFTEVMENICDEEETVYKICWNISEVN